MKRPISIALTIAIFAAIAVCFLRPAPPDFGYGDKVFNVCQTIKPNAYNEVRMTGDSEYFSNVIFFAHPNIAPLSRPVSLEFDEYSLVAGWEDIEIPQKIPPEFAVLEARSSNGWERISNAVWGGAWGTISPRSFSFSLAYPSEYQPGDYRFTVFFREAKDNTPHSISMYFSVPRKTSAQWDIVDVYWTPADEIWVTLRANHDDGVFPYIDCESVVLEKLESGKYVPLLPTDDGTPTIYPKHAKKRYEPMVPMGNIAIKQLIVSEDRAVGAEYRLSMTFVENEDGSGEQYTLTLRLRFDEQPYTLHPHTSTKGGTP